MEKCILHEIWGNSVVTGDVKADKPDLLAFINTFSALDIIDKHCSRKESKIAIHCDVDVDGIGTGYILGKTLQSLYGVKPIYVINKEKEHGVQQKHVDFFAKNPIDLMLIVDSSTNEIDIIKQFNCDVVVIDHHEVRVPLSELNGATSKEGCKYTIVNNTIENLEDIEINCWVDRVRQKTGKSIQRHDGDDRMSCGLVVYETLRILCDALGIDKLLENLRLYQWVGVTLFTDSITLNVPRNQWYIENTVMSQETETTLWKLLSQLNRFKAALDKTTISYTIAPVINKAIRAGHSGDALSCVVYNPSKVLSLMQFREEQDRAINFGICDVESFDSYILKDLTNSNINKNYNGVIASRLCGENNKNTLVFRVEDGIVSGSFRGRLSSVDYRELVDEYNEYSEGSGHKSAFGFKCRVEDLDNIMRKLTTIEENISTQPLITAGKMNSINPGKYVIEDMEEFKRQGSLWRLGIGNARLNNDEQVMITVSTSDVQLAEQKNKLYIYNVLGLQCKAFKPITTPVVNIYVEYSRQIDCYIKN